MMRTFNLKCKTITPLFLGGANQQAELRTQSINGILRWWFRIAGGSIEDERRIFGWGGDKANQGLVRLFIKRITFNSQDFDENGIGYNYLGFSLKMTRRKCVPINTQFDLIVKFHPKSTDDDIKKFFCALWLAFNLGNFGSRSRRGFGSIKVEKIEENNKDLISNCFDLSFLPTPQIENWIKDNLEKIKNILNPKPRNGIPYLFEHFEVYKYEEKNDWKNLMDQAGSEYKKFRQSKNINQRIVFGLPIVSVGRYRNLRKASPLMFKIIEISQSEYVLLFIIYKPKSKKDLIFYPDREINERVNWDLISIFVRNKQKIYPKEV